MAAGIACVVSWNDAQAIILAGVDAMPPNGKKAAVEAKTVGLQQVARLS